MKFRTIEKEYHSRIKVKGSKFLGYAFPVTSEEEIAGRLEEVRKRHYDATHHCYAWRLGGAAEARFRYNDDGEPSGTAGKPLYAAIQKRSLTNVLVISVRYFGGTKLGTGGLTRAYGSSAGDTLDAAKIRVREKGVKIRFRCSYEQHPHLLRILNAHHLIALDQDFGKEVRILAEVDEHDTENVLRDIKNVSNGDVRGEIAAGLSD